MGKIIPEITETKIGHELFSGLGRDETAEKYDVSEGTVSNKWAKVRDIIGPEGVALRDLAIELKKNKISTIKAKKGAEIASILQQIDMDPDKIYSFIENVYSLSADKDYTVENIIEDCKSLNNLEEESGLTGKQFLNWYHHTIPEKERIEKEVTQLKKQKEDLETELPDLIKLKNMKNTLLSNGITLQKLQSFLDTQKTLENLGFTKDAAHIFATEIHRTGLSPENAANRVASHLYEAQSLENKRYNLISENNSLEQQKISFTQEIIDSTNKLAEIEDKIQTTIDSENIIIEKAVKKFRYDTENKLEPLQTEINNKQQLIQETEYVIKAKTIELQNLEEKIEELKDKYILGESLIQILHDPASTTQEQLRRLFETTKKAIASREKGFPVQASIRTKEANKLLTDILTENTKKYFVPKYKYDNLQKSEEQHKAYAEEWKNKLDQNNKVTHKIIKDNEEFKKALGINAIKLIKFNYRDAPIQVLKNIMDWINQEIEERSGRTTYSKIQMSNETHDWFNTKIKELKPHKK